MHDGLVRMRLASGGDAEADVRNTLGRFCDSVNLMHVREAGEQLEYAWQIRLFHPDFGSRLSGELNEIEGVSGLSVLMQQEDARP